ncbi:MAG: competence/damage-inducible protein A [Chloroflexi bacterium]|nr:competence/damage-inducible protein A [Chloroflexota bacterium]
MRAEIVSVGTELLLGQITDTNASYLAGQLPTLGIDLYWVSQVGDNQERLVEVLSRALNRSDLVITTGGLGPTQDDITREAIAALLREEMTVDPELERWLRGFFQGRGLPMPQGNIKQAMLIPSARPIPNPQGTAPGWWVERDGRIIVAMPGVPREMYRMWAEKVVPRLRSRLGATVISSRTFKTMGLSEAAVDELIAPLLVSTNPTLATYAKADGIQVRLTAKGDSDEETESLMAPMEARLRSLLIPYIWGMDDDTLPGVIGALLRERGLTLATMESCTGGLLAAAVTDAPGSSDYFKGGIITYSNAMKVVWRVDKVLIEEYGAVSPQVAESMARAACQRLGADVGIGITGVAGPGELEGKPAGTVHISVTDGCQTRTISPRYPPDRTSVRQRAVMAALLELRRLLLSSD